VVVVLRDGVASSSASTAWGGPALDAIARRGAFFVRELSLRDEDGVALCKALVASGALRVAPVTPRAPPPGATDELDRG